MPNYYFNGYCKGVNDCIAIMSDLFDIHGDYSEVQEVYFEFCKRAKQLIKKGE